MARKTRSHSLESRSARVKLAGGKYHWQRIRIGLSVGYRKVKGNSGGTWTVRLLVDKDIGKYVSQTVGIADDHQESDGIQVLNYDQAQEACRKYAEDYSLKENARPSYTVKNAVDDYLEWFKLHRKTYDSTKKSCETHILPYLGDRPLADLTRKELKDWHNRLATRKAKLRSAVGSRGNTRETTDPRARKASANRILTILKAALNHAWDNHESVASEPVWRDVRAFRKVDAPNIQYLSQSECQRLINACPIEFRSMVQAALFTGARYGELAALMVKDLNIDSKSVHISESKSGKPRNIPLTDSGFKFFKRQTAGKKRSELLFTRSDGNPWGKSHQSRPLKEACDIAKIEPPITFHGLRHTYASALAIKGVPLQVIAAALGHADTRITEKHYAHLVPSYVADTIRANLPDLGAIEPDNIIAIS